MEWEEKVEEKMELSEEEVGRSGGGERGRGRVER